MNAHIRRAKDYIAKGEHCYRQAADELSAAHDEGATWAAIAQAMGRSENWVYKIIAWSKDTNGSVSSPFGGEAENEARYERQARGALADPERRRQAMRDLPTSEVEALQPGRPRSRTRAPSHAMHSVPVPARLAEAA